VVIKRSSAREVAALLQELQQGDEAAREAATARLAVIGTRAVDGLLAVAATPGEAAPRLAALAALEAIADPRAIATAAAALGEESQAVADAAAGVLRACLNSTRGTEALDRLAQVALDVGKPDHARVAAITALRTLPRKDTAPIWAALQADASTVVREAAVPGAKGPEPPAGGSEAPEDPVAALEAAAAGSLPEDPGRLRHWLAGDISRIPLPTLHRLVELVSEREAQRTAAERTAWMTARAAIHVALAQRGSRVALYDLRESIAKAPGAPVEMLTALEAIGDRSCLEPLASTYARLSTDAVGDVAWWREHIATAFRSIAAREKITERHAVARQIRTRWPAAAGLLPTGRRER
jgi:hypothetical protein